MQRALPIKTSVSLQDEPSYFDERSVPDPQPFAAILGDYNKIPVEAADPI